MQANDKLSELTEEVAKATGQEKEETQELKAPYTRLGKTGLQVSRVALGCMSFGSSKWQKWVIEEEEAFQIIKRAIELGVNFFDTADVYSNGESERILGNSLKRLGVKRSSVVIATKCFFNVWEDMSVFFMSPNPPPNFIGLSRKHIFEAVEASLERLQTSYIDLYQIHRWDNNTPIEETMEALHDLVKAGKVRYIGASSMWTWQFAKAQHIAQIRGWTPFVSMQNLYNLLYREEEREMIPLCLDQGVGGIPWSPLARGKLTPKDISIRSTNDWVIQSIFPEDQVDNAIVERVKKVAQDRSISTAQVAIAWLLSKPFVTAPIVGISKIENLEDIIKGLHVKLTAEEVKFLEEPYRPRAVVGNF